MKVCVMGLGYIGFPTACVVAQGGHRVLGVDINRELIARLNDGGLHIVNEDGLEELAAEALRSGALRVATVPESADVFLIAVPTPFSHMGGAGGLRDEILRAETDHQADLTYVVSATRSIAPFVRPGNLIILESTVPPHTTGGVVARLLAEEGVDLGQVLLAHAPERVLPGRILHELIHNDRIVGGLTPEAGQAAADFYRTFVKGEVVLTDADTAEMVKLMENTFRDVNIALANEVALVCHSLGINVWEAISLANRHPRVNFLRPGPGVGGHCIAVDPYFLVQQAQGLTPLIQAARRVNRRMPLHVVDLYHQLTEGITVSKVVLLGASYKANVGDARESPALEIAQLLADSGIPVTIHDPHVPQYSEPLESALAGADAVLLLTDHREYMDLAPGTAGPLMRRRLLLDARGLINAPEWEAHGFRVIQLGSGTGRQVPANG